MQSSGPSSNPGMPGNRGRREARPSMEADAELAQLIRAGDQQAFETFYDRFAPGLFSMIYAILHDQTESEEVLQEAFVQMWKRAPTYDPARSSLFTWAVMISRYKAIDRLGLRQRQSRLVEAVTERAGNSDCVAEERAAPGPGRKNERERVCAALEKLDDGQREAIDLAFFAGLTQAEIAEKVGAPPGTVKARIRHGLLALREGLKEVSP